MDSGRNNPANFADTAVLVVAAGRGSRAGEGLPKQYRRLAGHAVITHSIRRMAAALPGATILAVIHPDDAQLYAACTEGLADLGLRAPAYGGATRQDSVRAGLEVLHEDISYYKIVIIHDSVRIFAANELARNAALAAREYGAAVPACVLSDSLRRVRPDGMSDPADRSGLFAVQTPQAFRFDLILEAHRRAAGEGRSDFTDDASLAEWAGTPVRMIPGEPSNFKLTHPQDFAMAEALLLAKLGDIRTGYGYDVHAFTPGDHLWLGGLRIPHDHGLEGHSDADVGLHALTDAIFGALAEGDIGSHFPPSDPRWRGARSEVFLREAVRRVVARGGMIAHLDLTLVCEAPKVGPHRDAIRAEIARIAGLDIGRVAVKATTSEKLGFTGRREGIAANAVATIRLPL